MSDDVFFQLEPNPDHPGPDPDRINEDIAALLELTASGVAIDGEVQVAESTWVIYGHTSYDGEIIAGEYYDAVEALEVLRAVPCACPGDDGGPVP